MAKFIRNEVPGSSLVLNSLGILLNLIGLGILAMAYHKNFEAQAAMLKATGYSLFLLGLFVFVALKGMHLASYVARGLVGGLFIVSGLIKANDPLGFAYKLEEYFEDGALAYRIKEAFGWKEFSLEFLIDYALPISVFLCILEIVLGVLVIIGGKIKLTSWLLLGIMVFFTALTWHTAACDKDKKFIDRDRYELSNPLAKVKLEASKTNKDIKVISKSGGELVIDELKSPQCVSDCGCFGDAMKGSVGRSLTPVESLWKDIVLGYLVLLIFAAQWKIKPNSVKDNFVLIPYSLLLVALFSWVFGWYFPILFSIVCILSALYIKRSRIKMVGNYWSSAAIVTGVCGIFIAYVLYYEPLKDYRPYAVGSNLKEKMNDGIEQKNANTYIYVNIKTKKEKVLLALDQSTKNIWGDTEHWKFGRTLEKVLVEGRLPSITGQFNPSIAFGDIGPLEKDFSAVKEIMSNLMIDGVELIEKANNYRNLIPESEYDTEMYDSASYTFVGKVKIADPSITEVSLREWITTTPKVFLLLSKDLAKMNLKEIATLKSLAAKAKANKIPFILITSASREQVNKFRTKYKLEIPAFTNDETEMKAIARSNPSLLFIKKGIVIGKYPHRALPTWNWLTKYAL